MDSPTAMSPELRGTMTPPRLLDGMSEGTITVLPEAGVVEVKTMLLGAGVEGAVAELPHAPARSPRETAIGKRMLFALHGRCHADGSRSQ